jgi:hypothetical protein
MNEQKETFDSAALNPIVLFIKPSGPPESQLCTL